MEIAKPIAIALLFCLIGSSQQKPLTNQDIIVMTEAGVPETVILKRIQTGNNKFDLSAEALVRLKKSKVNETVIGAMMGIAPAGTAVGEKPGSSSTPGNAPVATANVAPKPASAAMEQIKKISFAEPEAHGVYWEAGNQLVPIPRSQQQLTANKKRTVITAGGALTALGVKSKSYTRLPTLQAKTRVPSDSIFVLHLAEPRIENIKVTKLEAKQGEREVVVSGKVYSSQSAEENGIEFALVKLKPELPFVAEAAL